MMGARLAAAALTATIKAATPLWQARARLVLTTMAVHARDDDPDPWWTGGLPFLAHVLDTQRPNDVSKALTILVDNGLIRRVYTTTNGARINRAKPARWMLTLWKPPVDNPPSTGPPNPPD